MRSIHGGSHINIAASSITSAHDTMFPERADYCGGLTARVVSDSCEMVRSFHEYHVYERSTSSTHVASRTWTLQERLLAPRTIYLGDTGIFWECRSGIASEFVKKWIPGQTLLRGDSQATRPTLDLERDRL